MIYAPLSDVGGVADDDAVYIDLKTVAYSKEEDLRGRRGKAVTGGAAADLVRRPQQAGDVDAKLEKSELRLFGGSRAVRGNTVEEDSSKTPPRILRVMTSRRLAKKKMQLGRPSSRSLDYLWRNAKQRAAGPGARL